MFWARRLPLLGSGRRGRDAGPRLRLGRVRRLLAVGGVRNTTAQGCGFVIAVDGDNYILTSAHVVAGGMTVLAFDDDGVAAGLTPLEFGDSGALRPGSFVVALSHPFGVQGAVTLGVLSGRIELPAFDPSSATATALTAAVAASVIFVAKALQWWRGKTTLTDAKEEYVWGVADVDVRDPSRNRGPPSAPTWRLFSNDNVPRGPQGNGCAKYVWEMEHLRNITDLPMRDDVSGGPSPDGTTVDDHVDAVLICTTMVALDGPLSLPEDGNDADHDTNPRLAGEKFGMLGWIARDSSKPG